MCLKWSHDSNIKKTCLVFLFLQKCVVDSFSPERRWSPSPRQQHRDHRETRGRGNRGLEVLHRYTEDPDQVHHSDDIWCVLLKMALPATVRMNNSHAANIKTHLSVEVKNKCLLFGAYTCILVTSKTAVDCGRIWRFSGTWTCTNNLKNHTRDGA